MSKSLQKPTILNVETVARSRLFTVESVDLEFSNGVRRVYERMRPTNREAVMIVPIVPTAANIPSIRSPDLYC